MVAIEQEWAFTKEFKVAFIPKKTSIGNMVTNIMLKNMLPCGRSVCATLAPKKKTEICYFTHFALSRKITVLFGWKFPKQNTVTEVFEGKLNEYCISLPVSPSQLWAEWAKTLNVRDLPTDSSCLKTKKMNLRIQQLCLNPKPLTRSQIRFLMKNLPNLCIKYWKISRLLSEEIWYILQFLVL